MPQHNAASQIWPHLQSGERPEQHQRGPGLAASLWPSQTPEAKAQAQAYERNRQILLRNLRETRLAMEALRKRR